MGPGCVQGAATPAAACSVLQGRRRRAEGDGGGGRRGGAEARGAEGVEKAVAGIGEAGPGVSLGGAMRTQPACVPPSSPSSVPSRTLRKKTSPRSSKHEL